MCAVVHALISDWHEAGCSGKVQIQGSVVATTPAWTSVVPKLFVSCVVAVVGVKSARLWRIFLHMEAQVPLDRDFAASNAVSLCGANARHKGRQETACVLYPAARIYSGHRVSLSGTASGTESVITPCCRPTSARQATINVAVALVARQPRCSRQSKLANTLA